MHLSRAPLTLAFSALLALPLVACANSLTGENRPSPIPSGYLEAVRSGAFSDVNENVDRLEERRGGEGTVDELLARVGGNVLTRRAVLRRLRINPAEMESGELEEEIMDERLRWAQLQLFINGFKQSGLTVPPSKLDDFIDGNLKKVLKAESERAGEPISRERYLREKGMSWEDYRRDSKDEFMRWLYTRYKLSGLGGARAEVDAHVTPAEVRQVYFNNPEAWNEKAKFKVAIFQIFVKGLADEEHTIVEWEALAERRAQGLSALFQGIGSPTGPVSPERLEQHYGLDDENKGSVTVRDDAVSAELLARVLPIPEFRDWILDPARKSRDVKILRERTGPVVIGIVDATYARVVPFDEAYDAIEERIKTGQVASLRARIMIDMIREGAAVYPPELADEILDQAHKLRAAIRTDKVLKTSRLR